jgi:hypothetical protein
MSFLLTVFPEEIIEQILLYCDPKDIIAIGKDNVPERTWLRNKDEDLEEASKNGNLV